jgi:heptosyltransferase-3
MDTNLLPAVPVIFDLPMRRFAAALAQCSLFVSCDSGPMHLACALGIRTIAIFLKKNFNRWGPPAERARIVFDPNGVSVDAVEAACVAEWSRLMSRPEFVTTVKSHTISASTA